MNGALQGTTPKLEIKLPNAVSVDSLIGVELTFKHDGNMSIYGLSDVTPNAVNNTITYNFTEAETLAFNPDEPVYWQARFKTAAGITGTKKAQFSVYDLMSDREMQ